MEYKKGAKGAEVKNIQELLNAAYFNVPSEKRLPKWTVLTPDGIYGQLTHDAVESFQTYKEIKPVSGIVGDTTYHYLENFCPTILGAGSHDEDDYQIERLVMDYFIKPASESIASFLSEIQNDFTKKSKDIAQLWNKTIVKIKSLLLALMAKFKSNKEKVYQQLKQYFEKKRHLSPNRKNKQNKYDKRIDKLLNENVGNTNKIKLNPNMVQKHLKVGKTLTKAGGQVQYVELYWSLGNICFDINDMDDTKAWLDKWTKDVSKLIDVLIGLLVGAIIVLLLPEELCLVVVFLILGVVGIIVSYLLELFHATALGKKVDEVVGRETANFIKTWEVESNAIAEKNRRAEEAWVSSQGTITIKLFEKK